MVENVLRIKTKSVRVVLSRKMLKYIGLYLQAELRRKNSEYALSPDSEELEKWILQAIDAYQNGA